jgi:putative heme-binding domain-containing protein
LLTDDWPIDDVFGPPKLSAEEAKRVETECTALISRLCDIARRDDSGVVRLTLASTLQRMPVVHRAVLAEQLLLRPEDADDHNLPLLVWYGLMPVAEDHPMALVDLAVTSRWPTTQRLIARRLAEQIENHPGAIEELLAEAAVSVDAKARRNILKGFADGLRGWTRAPQPKNWTQFVSAVSADRDESTMSVARDLSVLFGDGRALEEVRQIVLDQDAEIGLRRSALETLVAGGGEEIRDVCLTLLDDARLNVVAAKGLSKSNDVEVAGALIENYRRFRAPQRPQIIEMLVSRRSFAAALLDAIAAKQIPETELTAFDVRQIRTLNDASLQHRISELWGEVRDSPEAKRQQIDSLKQQLTIDEVAAADLARGRVLFNESCAKCHKLFGQGEAIGPDLTGGNRNNLDYLLENIFDPSAVVSKDYRMTIVRMGDGRVLNGLVVSRNDKTLTLQTQTDKLTVSLDDIEETSLTTLSPMPDGLCDNLVHDQVRELIAYLMQPTQVPLPQASE